MIIALLSANADAGRGAEWSAHSPERSIYLGPGHWPLPLGTRVRTVDVAVPELRSGSDLPSKVREDEQVVKAFALLAIGSGGPDSGR